MDSQELIELIEKEASDHFETEAEKEAFLEGFYKEAFVGLPQLGSILSGTVARAITPRHLSRPAAALGVGLAGAAIVKGINTAYAGATNMRLRSQFENALAQVMAGNRVVKGADPVKAKTYAETIFKFAPRVAADPNLLSSILANAVHGEGIDPMTIKTLVDLESRHVDNTLDKPLTGIRV